MRAYELLTEAVGRDLQHVEDIIYIYGPQAALEAVARLQQLGVNSKEMQIKFDGSPAVTFGREANGQFHFGDKHSKELNLSPADIENVVMSRNYAGKGDPNVDKERKKFAATQSNLWKLYEAATPKDFRGFVDGDLLWAAPPALVKDEYTFGPNTVQYFVKAGSPLGQRIKTSQSGVACHFYKEALAAQTQALTPEIISRLGSQQVVVLGPKTTAEVQANVDNKQLTSLAAAIKKTAKDVEAFLAEEPGLKSVAADVYKYINSNQEVATPEHFLQWCQQNLTASKAAKIAAKNQNGLKAIFIIMHEFVKIKVDIIKQVEQPAMGGLAMRAVLKNINVPGGEGLVDSGSETPMKFVDRATFSKANKIR